METHALLHLLEGLVDLGCARPSQTRLALFLEVGNRGCWVDGAAECLLLMRMGSGQRESSGAPLAQHTDLLLVP